MNSPIAHPDLNSNKCWAPPRKSYDWSQYQAPVDWTTQFKQFFKAQYESTAVLRSLCNNNPWEEVEKDINRQLGICPQIAPPTSPQLQKTLTLLSQINAVLQGEICDPRIQYQPEDTVGILSELLDGIRNCAAGIFERAHMISERMNQTFDLNALLINYRIEIVERIARQSIQRDLSQNRLTLGMEVHERDRYFIAANHLDYGVNAAYGHYKDASCLEESHIIDIQKGFKTAYTPLLIMGHIESILLRQVNDLEYTGENKTPYPYEKALAWSDLFTKFFNLPEKNIYDFCLFSETGEITGINWNAIRIFIVEKLMSSEIIESKSNTKSTLHLNETIHIAFDPHNENEYPYLQKLFKSNPLFLQNITQEEIITLQQSLKFWELVCKDGHTQMGELLLKDANDDTKKKVLLASDTYGPAYGFRLACANGHAEMVEALLQQAPDDETKKKMLYAKGSNGIMQGFRLACQNGHTEVVKVLLNYADQAIKKEMLLSRGPDGPAFIFRLACHFGHAQVIDSLLESADEKTKKEMLLAFGSDGLANGFRLACQGGHARVIESLLKHADDETKKQMLLAGDRYGNAHGFRLACIRGHAKVVDLLLQHADGETKQEMLLASGSEGSAFGFRMACEKGHVKVVESLLKHANTDTTEQMLLTGSGIGFKWACINGQAQIVELLLQHTDEKTKQQLLFLQTKQSISAIELAQKKNHPQVARAILLSADSLNLLHSLKKESKQQIPFPLTLDEMKQFLDKFKPSEKKEALKILSTLIDESSKKEIIQAISQQTQSITQRDSKTIHQYYKSQAGFFSNRRHLITAIHDPKEILPFLLKCLDKNFKGASMLTLLSILEDNASHSRQDIDHGPSSPQ